MTDYRYRVARLVIGRIPSHPEETLAASQCGWGRRQTHSVAENSSRLAFQICISAIFRT